MLVSINMRQEKQFLNKLNCRLEIALLLLQRGLTAVEELSLECPAFAQCAAAAAAVKQKVSDGKLATYPGGGMFIFNTKGILHTFCLREVMKTLQELRMLSSVQYTGYQLSVL